ncbi:UDP binding domain-containing protein [Sulfurovum sp.]|uniref:UDP binding domain-containing protein n=1 Tax=Sulfurovum sp. TaxID=1969726 RepID=UPI00356976EB
MDRLNDLGKALNGAKILILGIAYKKNVGDMRESPSFELIEILRDNGAVVS